MPREVHLLAILIVLAACTGRSWAKITISCEAVCDQVESVHGEEDSECDAVCRMKQCKDGCLDWREGTRSSCQQICTLHGWESEDTMFCTMGCVYAAQSYIRQIEELIGKPPAPLLVGKSVSGSSVGLRWSGAPEVEDVKYLVQYQQNKGPPEWVYYRPSHPVNATEIIVEDLKPYTKYQFRIAWLVLPRHTPILSNPSSWISTLASGPPRSPPRELRAVPLDWSRVEVSWDPPLFPGGDLISYTLYSKDAEGKQEMRDNIDANSERRYILSELSANTTYILNLTSTNRQGEGPAVVAQVTTYPTAPAVDDGQGYLLLTSGSRILKLGLDITDAPQHLYNVSEHLNITGMAVYIPFDVIFISDTGGSITQLIPSSKKVYTLLTQNHLHGYPLSLSVDWLYYHLYYIVRLEPTVNNVWQLWRCNLNGKQPVLIYGELHYEPKHLQVDPYNGYIWWISEDVDGGLYRLDMNDSDETREPEIVLSSPELDLGGLVLDPPNFQVLVADRKNNAMLAVSLDGTSVTNLRANTQRAFFQHLKSVVHLNSRFFWTDGSEVYTEELNDGTFYHISYVVMNSMNTVDVGTLVAVHGSTQPVPVPLNPPTDLQAVFTRTTASLRWNAPALPALMGSRAWQMWRYEVHIQEGRKTISDKNITRTTYQAVNLRPGTFYIIKVQAYSLGGKGPWSREFRGRTLDATDDAPQLVWATEDNIVMSNLVGSDSSVLVPQETLQTKLKGEKIVDLAFFRDTLVMAVSNQSVFLMNMTASTFAEVPNTHGVLSVSVDWLTQRLFWANPHRQMIGWSSLQGTSQGPLNVVTAAREVRVDALHGRLFWTTPHGLLVSTLAGRNVSTIHQEGIFSGKQVYGLTVDTFGARIWWIVRDAEGCKLFGASMKDKVVKFPTKALPQPVMLGPMWYLSERLLWLGEDGDLVVSDTSLNNSAALHTSSLGMLHFTVILPDLQPMPANVLEPHVIPGQIDETSVVVEGTWEEFVLRWSPITNINYGNLLYEVIIDNGAGKKAILTRNNSIPYEEKLPPYSPLKLSVRGITDWSVGTRLIKTIRTPASLPGPPQDLRTFVQKVQDTVAIIHLRWSAPEKPNGEITSYEVIYCAGESDGGCRSVSVEGSQNQVMVEDLSPDQVYRFKVAAVNEIGKGPYSSDVTEGLQQHMPTPSLIVVAGEALMKLDADLQEEREILSENSRVQWVSALLSNSSFAWMDMNSDVYITHLTTNYTERLLRLGGQGVGLAADWVGEIIVWAERPSVGSRDISLQMLEIEYKTKKSLAKINLSDPIKKFLLSPATSQVLMLHDSYRGSKLSIVSFAYSKVVLQDVFSQERNLECTCSKNPSLVGGVALDTTNLTHPALYFVAGGSSSETPRTTVVYKTDLHGCDCESVFVPEDFGYGPCVEIAVDFAHLYCYVGVNQTLLWLPKTGTVSADSIHAQYLYNATSLIPLDLATQPMPEPECLITSNYTDLPELAGSQETAIAIKLKIPEVKVDACGSLPLPPIMYTVYYAPESDSDEGSCVTDAKNCRQRRSTNNVITVDGLQPFTRYVFRASVETVYNNRLGVVSIASPSATFKTKAKAPESVGKITAEVLSPEEIDVSFASEADQVYEIHWQGEASSAGPLRFHVNSTGRFRKRITKLSPNTKYEVWVRVYSKDKLLYTDSPREAVITLPELPYLRLENTTARALYVSWISPSDHSVLRHVIEYIPRGETLWKHLSMVQTSPGHKYLANITDLVPATSYLLRLRVIYNNTLHSFTWPGKPLFNFTTLGEVPGAPGQVMRQTSALSSSVGLRVWWTEAESKGAPVIAYTLQAAPYTSDQLDGNRTFTTVYNSTENYWLIEGLEESASYIFRARAINELGVGPWGKENLIDTVIGPKMLPQTDLPTILASTIPTSFVFIAFLLFCLVYGMKRAERRRKVKAVSVSESSHPHHHHLRNREVELATLRQLPTNNNFVTENNVLYNLHTFPGDDLDLPHVSRHCITLTKFLGSGAFGEVFEGTACELPGLPEVTKVAIKTLRKGATEAEKAEFLKEAQLMSHFQHEHILRLLAVCTDHDPFFLILELMEGGDLLSYLRTSRGAECGLTLADLVAMCVDVAKGCVYLEEMHYVHRDLAARNCLVSTTDPESRIVKIGDFGLARDIYKNDYYRKEGEGLLPVRWMSPESLVDGVFTSHSDVWAFGVLLWEILTLGQQPYPARTNLEVLHYVRSGGRLNRPPNCPEELHKLMERCWSYSPENRPTFRECLSTLLMLEETISALPALAVHNVHYIGSNGNSLVSANGCSATNSWSTQTSSSVANLGPRRGSGPEDRAPGGEAEECDSFSGASTLPLTAPLRRHQQYLQLVNEPSPTSPPVSPRSEASSDWPRFSSSAEAPPSSTSLIAAAQAPPSSSPPGTSHASPVPESPTSVTFTFPLPSLQSVVSPQHYLRPSSNKVFAGPSRSGSSENEEELDAGFGPAQADNSYVNMSAGAELKLMDEVTEAADLEKINGVNMRIKRDDDLQAELDSHRLSGLSGLSAVSGMTSASTVDLDHSPSQSWC